MLMHPDITITNILNKVNHVSIAIKPFDPNPTELNNIYIYI